MGRRNEGREEAKDSSSKPAGSKHDTILKREGKSKKSYCFLELKRMGAPASVRNSEKKLKEKERPPRGAPQAAISTVRAFRDFECNAILWKLLQ